MKTINLLCIAMMAIVANARRHHRHSNFEQTAFNEIESMFKLMNSFNDVMQVPQETEIVKTVEIAVPEEINNVQGKLMVF